MHCDEEPLFKLFSLDYSMHGEYMYYHELVQVFLACFSYRNEKEQQQHKAILEYIRLKQNKKDNKIKINQTNQNKLIKKFLENSNIISNGIIITIREHCQLG